MAQNYLYMCMSKTFLKKMVEIKNLVINFIYLISIEDIMWQHDIGHYKLVTSCMIVACVIRSTKGKYNQLK